MIMTTKYIVCGALLSIKCMGNNTRKRRAQKTNADAHVNIVQGGEEPETRRKSGRERAAKKKTNRNTTVVGRLAV